MEDLFRKIFEFPFERSEVEDVNDRSNTISWC
jgi:hypothetical protein